MSRPITRLFLILTTALVGACAQPGTDVPGMLDTQSHANASSVRMVPMTAATVGMVAAPSLQGIGGYEYRIGIGDVLQLHVVDAPELEIPQGYRVEADGMIQVPFLGRVAANGQTPQTLRTEIAQRLRPYIRQPQVEVRITAFNARHVSIIGAVRRPNRQALTETPLTVIDAINAAGGFGIDPSRASVTLVRGGVEQAVDIAGFLQHGRALPILIEGDVLRVSAGESQVATRLAAPETPVARLVTAAGQALAIPLSGGPVSVAQLAPSMEPGNIVLLRRDAQGVAAHQFTGMDSVAPEIGGQVLLAPGDVLTSVPALADPAATQRHLSAALRVLNDQ